LIRNEKKSRCKVVKNNFAISCFDFAFLALMCHPTQLNSLTSLHLHVVLCVFGAKGIIKRNEKTNQRYNESRRWAAREPYQDRFNQTTKSKEGKAEWKRLIVFVVENGLVSEQANRQGRLTQLRSSPRLMSSSYEHLITAHPSLPMELITSTNSTNFHLFRKAFFGLFD